MADEGGGTFDGGGSVRWKVVSEDGTNVDAGVDQNYNANFRLILKVPERDKDEFLKQFSRDVIFGNKVKLKMPVENVPKQIRVRWHRDTGTDE
jgi:hypothetical protein